MSFLKNIGNGIANIAKAATEVAYQMTFRGQFETVFKLYKNKQITENEFINRVNNIHDKFVEANVKWETSEYRSRV